MGTWQDEPGARQWRAAADAADQLREPGVPLQELSGFHRGVAAVEEAQRLLADPTAPGALTAARVALRRALRQIPQSRPDSLCHETRWRARRRWPWDVPPADVCDRPTCGRCLPLKAAVYRTAELGHCPR